MLDRKYSGRNPGVAEAVLNSGKGIANRRRNIIGEMETGEVV